jgi:hypothetical protein
MATKRTGLGKSLLLRRTEADEPSPRSEDAQSPPPTDRFDTDETSQPPASPRRPRALRDRCTIYIEPEVNKQLDLVARIQRRQRSEVVTQILRENLPKYRIDLQ